MYFLAKPIDLLARYINAEDDEDSAAIELHEPYTYLNVMPAPCHDTKPLVAKFSRKLNLFRD